MRKNEFLIRLSFLHSEIKSNIHNLNYGGCGIFALMFYEEISKILPKNKCRISIYDRYVSIKDKKNIVKNLKNNGGNIYETDVSDLSSHHIMVKLYELQVDGYNLIPHKEKKYHSVPFKGYVTQEELEYSLRYGRWNRDYNQSQNKKLRSIIQKYFGDKRIDIKLLEKKYKLLTSDKKEIYEQHLVN